MKCNIIFSDLDGVVCDMVGALIKLVYDEFGVVCSPDMITQYNAFDSLYPAVKNATKACVTKDAFKQHISHLWICRKTFSELSPYWQTWRGMKEARFPINFITNRPAEFSYVTKNWLHRWGLYFFGLNPDEVQNRVATNVIDKGKFIKDWITEQDSPMPINVLVFEDAYENALSIVNQNENARVCLIRRPWNQSFAPQEGPSNTRIQWIDECQIKDTIHTFSVYSGV